jgi:hypothetical protein
MRASPQSGEDWKSLPRCAGKVARSAGWGRPGWQCPRHPSRAIEEPVCRTTPLAHRI